MAVNKSDAGKGLPPQNWFASFPPDYKERAEQIVAWARKNGLEILRGKSADVVDTYHVTLPDGGEFVRLITLSIKRPEFDIGGDSQPQFGDPPLRTYAPFDDAMVARRLYEAVCFIWGKAPKQTTPKYVLGEWKALLPEGRFAAFLEVCEGVLARLRSAQPPSPGERFT